MELDLEKLPIEEKKLWDDSCRIPSASGLSLCLPNEFRCLYIEEYRHRLLLCWIRLLHFCILSISSGCYIYIIVHICKFLASQREWNQCIEYFGDHECEQICIWSEFHNNLTACSIHKSMQCCFRSVYISFIYQEWRRSLGDSLLNIKLSVPSWDYSSFKHNYIQTVRCLNS